MSNNFDTDVHEMSRLLKESEKDWSGASKKNKPSLTEGKRPEKRKQNLTENEIKQGLKKVKSKAWAKKVSKKWHNMMTTAGDRNGITKERELGSDEPKIVTKNGLKNVFSRFINDMMDSVGANIGSQIWNMMSEKDLLQMLGNIAKEVGVTGPDKIEKMRKTGSSDLSLNESKELTESKAKISDYMKVMDAKSTEKFMKEFKVDKGSVDKVDGGYQLNKKIAKELVSSVNNWNSGKPLKGYEKEIELAGNSVANEIIKRVSKELGIKPKGIKVSVKLNNDSTMIEVSYKGVGVGRDFFYYDENSAMESVDDSISHGSLEHLVWVFYSDSPFFDSTFNEMVIETEKRMGQNEMTYQDDMNVMELEREVKAMLQNSMEESVDDSLGQEIICENLILEAILSEGVSSKVLKQYIETALWSTDDGDDGNLDDDHGYSDVDKSALRQAKKDLDKFWKLAGDLLDDEDETDIAHDFLLTRNGHGAGFWDGDYEKEKGKALTKISEKFGQVDFYLGDDGKIYS